MSDSRPMILYVVVDRDGDIRGAPTLAPPSDQYLHMLNTAPRDNDRPYRVIKLQEVTE